MNDDIKNGANQLAKGLKVEANEFKIKALEKIDQVKNSLDKNNDGKIDFKETGENITEEVKKTLDKVAKLLEDESVSAKTKAELSSIIKDFKTKITPAVDNFDKKLTEFVKDKQKEFGPTIDNVDKGITDSVKNIPITEIIEDTKKDLKSIPDEIKDTVEEVKKIANSAKTKIQNEADAKKMEAEILKEKIDAQIEHAKEIEDLKEELLEKKDDTQKSLKTEEVIEEEVIE